MPKTTSLALYFFEKQLRASQHNAPLHRDCVKEPYKDMQTTVAQERGPIRAVLRQTVYPDPFTEYFILKNILKIEQSNGKCI